MDSLTLFSLSCLSIAVSNFLLAIFSVIFYKQKYIWSLFIFYLVVGGWALGLGLEVSSDNFAQGLFWANFLLANVIFIPVTFLHFVLDFINHRKRTVVYVSYLFSTVLLIGHYFGIFIEKVQPIAYYMQPKPAYLIIVLYFIFLTIYTFHLLFKCSKSLSAMQKNQVMYFTLFAGIGYVSGSITYLPVYGISISP